MVGIAAHTGDPLAFGFDQHAATDAAVTTGGFDFSFHDFPSALPLATGMPPGKSSTWQRKREIPDWNFPFLVQARSAVPI
jgi:hypothetical protein